ncbi:ABC transporter substrate-binding protein [Liquorilactobacillus mali]|nr:ABC transporter substrate-binding protein [Liquorilactobacillus mali]
MNMGKIKNKFIRYSFLLMILGISLVLTACGNSKSSSSGNSKTSKNTLYIGTTNAPAGFNPINETDVAGQWILRMIYPSLLDQPKANKFQGNLAKSFTTKDNQHYTITLRNAKWSDGKAITAEDVAYTLNLIGNPDVETSYGANISRLQGVNESGKTTSSSTPISGVKVVNSKTLTLTTKAAIDPNYVKEMIGFDLVIVPKHVVEKYNLKELANSKFTSHPTVSGSIYKFVKYNQNSYVKLTANPTYYKGKAKIKNVYIKILTSNTLVTQLKSGSVDMSAGGGIGTIPVADVERSLKTDKNLTVKAYPYLQTQYMYINNSKFTNKNIRLAMTYAINREAIVKKLFRGQADILPSTYTKATKYYDSSLKALPYNLKKAKALLKKSGYDGHTIKLIVPTGNVARQQSANMIQQNLESAGFKVKQVSYDFPTALAKIKSGDYELSLLGLSLNVDPDQSYLYTPSGSMNFGKVNDSKLTEMFNDGLQATTVTERKKIYSSIQKYMRDNAFTVGLYSDYPFIIQNKSLHGGINKFWVGSLYNMQDWTKK